MRQLVSLLVLGFALASGCAADRPPEEITDDGLVRVPARSVGGVYRAPDATFTQYRRIILEPPSIAFIKDWRKKHPDVTDAEYVRMGIESINLFRDEFTRQLVERGPYTFADDYGPDVLLIIPNVEDLDIVAPDTGGAGVTRTYTPLKISMKVSGDLRDASTGKLIGRVIMIQPPERSEFREMREATRVTNAHEQRLVFSRWSQLVLEALNVAKAEKPRPPATPAPR